MKDREIWVPSPSLSVKKKSLFQGTYSGAEIHPDSHPVLPGYISLESNQLGSEADH